MKKFLLASLLILLPFPALAAPVFKYKTACYLETKEHEVFDDICTVVETREDNGALRTRNIYSNKFRITIKNRWDKKNGFMTWDSYNKYEYKWEYKLGNVKNSTDPHTYVMPGVLVESISWD